MGTIVCCGEAKAIKIHFIVEIIQYETLRSLTINGAPFVPVTLTRIN
jgi:hypothetical protein